MIVDELPLELTSDDPDDQSTAQLASAPIRVVSPPLNLLPEDGSNPDPDPDPDPDPNHLDMLPEDHDGSDPDPDGRVRGESIGSELDTDSLYSSDEDTRDREMRSFEEENSLVFTLTLISLALTLTLTLTLALILTLNPNPNPKP